MDVVVHAVGLGDVRLTIVPVVARHVVQKKKYCIISNVSSVFMIGDRVVDQFENVILEVREEYDRAVAKFGSFSSGHEGYAIILEEMDELWEGIKNDDSHNMREEIIQVAAMAIRFYVDIIKRTV